MTAQRVLGVSVGPTWTGFAVARVAEDGTAEYEASTTFVYERALEVDARKRPVPLASLEWLHALHTAIAEVTGEVCPDLIRVGEVTLPAPSRSRADGSPQWSSVRAFHTAPLVAQFSGLVVGLGIATTEVEVVASPATIAKSDLPAELRGSARSAGLVGGYRGGVGEMRAAWAIALTDPAGPAQVEPTSASVVGPARDARPTTVDPVTPVERQPTPTPAATPEPVTARTPAQAYARAVLAVVREHITGGIPVEQAIAIALDPANGGVPRPGGVPAIAPDSIARLLDQQGGVG